MHSCYTPLFLHLHCAHYDLSIAYTLRFALAYAFPFVFILDDPPFRAMFGPCVCTLLPLIAFLKSLRCVAHG